MSRTRGSEDVASEPYAARVDDANGPRKSKDEKINANLCSQNWWRYT
jgi:hypothetical protein